jgi:hypothetical protein
MKWIGISVLSLVMGLVVAGLAQWAAPSLPYTAYIVIAIVGTALVLKPMIDVARTAGTIEPHHGKQFD